MIKISKEKYKNNDIQTFLISESLKNQGTDLFLFSQNSNYAEEILTLNYL